MKQKDDTPTISVFTITLETEEMKKVTTLSEMLQAKPEQLLHVICMGTINDHLNDSRVNDALRSEIAARFPMSAAS
jgi:hypothetical protein